MVFPVCFSVTRLCWLATVVILLASHESAAESKNGFALDDALVPAAEILNGGPGRDGIPSLDYPEFVSAGDARFLKAKDRVLGLVFDGVARAYPIRILNYHEIVNDAFGGNAVVVTYCPLCNSGMAFNAKIDRARLEFGVSGLLYNSDVLLYDRQTGSLWSQIMQTAITGTMKGTKLDAFPMTHTTWRDWVARYPETEVLSDRTGSRRNYEVNPYPGYRRDGSLYFPVAEENSRYRRKSLVMGLEIDGHFKAYPFSELNRSTARFTDEFQGQSFEVRYDKKNETAMIIGEDGTELPTLLSFWFAWYAFHPDTEIYTAD
jgi:hypothetical protein